MPRKGRRRRNTTEDNGIVIETTAKNIIANNTNNHTGYMNVNQALKELQKSRELAFDPTVIPYSDFSGRLLGQYPGDVSLENISRPIHTTIMNIESDFDYDDLTGYDNSRENVDDKKLDMILRRFHDMMGVLNNHNLFDSFIRSMNVLDRIFANNGFEQYLVDLMNNHQALSDHELLAFQEVINNYSYKEVTTILLTVIDVLTEYNRILQSNETFRDEKDEIYREMNEAIEIGNDKMSIAKGVFEPFRRRKLMTENKFQEYSDKIIFDLSINGPGLAKPQEVDFYRMGGNEYQGQNSDSYPIRRIVNGREEVLYPANDTKPITNTGMDNEFNNSIRNNTNNYYNQEHYPTNDTNGYRTTSTMKIINPNLSSNNQMRSDDGIYTTDQYGQTHTTINGVDVIVATPEGPVSIEQQNAQIQEALNQQQPQVLYDMYGNKYVDGVMYANPANVNNNINQNTQEYTFDTPYKRNPAPSDIKLNVASENDLNLKRPGLSAQRRYNVDANGYSINNPLNAKNIYGCNTGNDEINRRNRNYLRYFNLFGYYPNTVGRNYYDEVVFNQELAKFVNVHKNTHKVVFEFGVPVYMDANNTKVTGFFPPIITSDKAPYYMNGRYGTALVVGEHNNGSETILRLQQENGNMFDVHFSDIVLGKLQPKTIDKQTNEPIMIPPVHGIMNLRMNTMQSDHDNMVNDGMKPQQLAGALRGINTIGNTHDGLVDQQKVPTITPSPNERNNGYQQTQERVYSAGSFNNNNVRYVNNKANANAGYMNTQNANTYNANNQYSSSNTYVDNRQNTRYVNNNAYNTNTQKANPFAKYTPSVSMPDTSTGFEDYVEYDYGDDRKWGQFGMLNNNQGEVTYTNTNYVDNNNNLRTNGAYVNNNNNSDDPYDGLPNYMHPDYNPYLDLNNPLYGRPEGDYSRITEYNPNTGLPIKKKTPQFKLYSDDMHPYI